MFPNTRMLNNNFYREQRGSATLVIALILTAIGLLILASDENVEPVTVDAIIEEERRLTELASHLNTLFELTEDSEVALKNRGATEVNGVEQIHGKWRFNSKHLRLATFQVQFKEGGVAEKELRYDDEIIQTGKAEYTFNEGELVYRNIKGDAQLFTSGERVSLLSNGQLSLIPGKNSLVVLNRVGLADDNLLIKLLLALLSVGGLQVFVLMLIHYKNLVYTGRV